MSTEILGSSLDQLIQDTFGEKIVSQSR